MTSRGPTDNKIQVGAHLIIYGGELNTKFDEAIRECKKLQFDFLEAPLNIVRMSAKFVSSTCDRYELPLVAIHVGIPDVATQQSLEAKLRYCNETGATKLICSGCEEGAPEEAGRSTAATLNKVGRTAKQYGVELYYHFFDYVFEAPASREAIVDTLLTETDPDFVKINVDTLWAAVGGRRPDQLIRQVGKRCDYYHFKDGTGVYNDALTVFRPLGAGEINLRACITAIAENWESYQIVVEQDRPLRTPCEDLGQSMRWLNHQLNRHLENG